MKKTDTRNRRKKNQQALMPFLPAWVHLIDNTSGSARCALGPGYIMSPATVTPLKVLSTQKDRTVQRSAFS